MGIDRRSSRAAAAAIAGLNDELRINRRGGRIVITRGVASLAWFDPWELASSIAAYNRFDDDNDPHEERDFGTFELFGAKLMWKIDYYDPDLKFGSDNPADPNATLRVLTVMLESEY